MSMNENVTFASSLTGWATVPAAAAEAVEVWQTASNLITDSPINGLRSDAYSGTLNPKNITKRLTDAAQVIAAQVTAPTLVNELDAPLSQRFADAIFTDGDRIINELAVHFDKYAGYMEKYAPAVPPGVSAEELLTTGNADVLAAWQNLGIAETTLETVATFRSQLTSRYNYPAPTPGITAWIGPVRSADDIHRAALAWRGHLPIAGAQDGMTNPLVEVRGGRWRWLVEAGFTLACNDQHQAAQVAAPLTPVAA